MASGWRRADTFSASAPQPQLAGFFLRNFCAFLTGLREADGNRLFPASYHSAFAALSGTKSFLLFTAHCTLRTFTCCFSVFCHSVLPPECRVITCNVSFCVPLRESGVACSHARKRT